MKPKRKPKHFNHTEWAKRYRELQKERGEIDEARHFGFRGRQKREKLEEKGWQDEIETNEA